MSARPDTAGVIAPPPLIALAALLIGLALEWLLPTSLASTMPPALRIAIGVALIAVGLAFVISANVTFRRAGTNVEPWKPSVVLVSAGVFGWLRNPMYVGGTLVLFGLAISLNSLWLLFTTVISALMLHFGVVKREERYLESKFGAAYRDYCGNVGRYGWRRR